MLGRAGPPGHFDGGRFLPATSICTLIIGFSLTMLKCLLPMTPQHTCRARPAVVRVRAKIHGGSVCDENVARRPVLELREQGSASARGSRNLTGSSVVMLCSQAFSAGNAELAGVYTRIATLCSLAAAALLAIFWLGSKNLLYAGWH